MSPQDTLQDDHTVHAESSEKLFDQGKDKICPDRNESIGADRSMTTHFLWTKTLHLLYA